MNTDSSTIAFNKGYEDYVNKRKCPYSSNEMKTQWKIGYDKAREDDNKKKEYELTKHLCSACSGTGKIVELVFSHEYHKKIVNCPYCNGTGVKQHKTMSR